MTVEELSERMSSAELTQWLAYFRAQSLAKQQNKTLEEFLDQHAQLIEDGA